MNKAIVILGGMGPEASVLMYKTLTELSFGVFGAKNNDDFPEILLNSIPVPDFIAKDTNKKIALKMLKERTAGFNSSQTLCLSIACNTAHILLDELRKVTNIPFVSMIEEVGKKIEISEHKSAGIIATPSTLRYGLYQGELEKRNIRSIVPNDRDTQKIEKIIRNIIKGKMLRSDTNMLRKIADRLKKKGADCIVLGCTETPIAFPKLYSLPVYNSIEIVSLALLRKYYKYHKMS